MAIVNVTGISGINSITAQSTSLNFYTAAGNTLSIGASVSGNITGNVTGNLTGNVNATGVSTFSGGVVVAAGTTAAPSISPSGDSNTGIFFPSADTIAFGEGGVEAARFDSSGRLGIGTATPNGLLSLPATASNTPKIRLQSSSSSADIAISSYEDSNGSYASFGANHYLDSNGNDAAFDATKRSAYVFVDGRNNGAVIFGTAASGTATERARFNSTGAFVLAGGTTTADGVGIAFPATQSASTNANTLDDYEEGTWTPTLSFSGGGTPTYNHQWGLYTKVGQIVHVGGFLQVSSLSGCSGSPRIVLPFTTFATSLYYHGPAIGYYGQLTGITAYGLGLDIAPNGVLGTLFYGNGTGVSALTTTNMTSTFFFEWAFTYRSAS